MQYDSAIDIIEDDIEKTDKVLLGILLMDKTTQKNIIWGTNDYSSLGEDYEAAKEIHIELITGANSKVIQPRILKAQTKQQGRTRDKAEVFTPSWVCNAQNNLVDEQWFGRSDVFNTSSGHSWKATSGHIKFSEKRDRSWKAYIDSKRLEITCGEAPYLVSRYDTVTGEKIPLDQRIGLLDRKMRIVKENTTTAEEWLTWAQRAFESVYGFEYQGDNLLLARENLLYSYIEYYYERFCQEPSISLLRKIARIISWNIWQMDGLKCVVPGSCKPEENPQFTLFDYFGDDGSYADGSSDQCPGCARGDIYRHTGDYCRIMDWRSKRSQTFLSMMKGGRL